jgi:16S rRNA C967 or C1407 C5-methylase (RsmB/RsmF family)
MAATLLMNDAVSRSLETVYRGRLGGVIDALGGMGPRYFFRLNGHQRAEEETIGDMRAKGFDVGVHGTIADAALLPVEQSTPLIDGTLVQADRFAAEAVMQGAHLYAPGVKNCKGLRIGMQASVIDRSGTIVGSGVARQGETSILRYHRGVAVETLKSRFRIPPLRETSWYSDGLIHLQSLPSMTTCHVLDPKPNETIIDLNCSPAGKMSYMCQLSNNEARIIGFDRNERKVDKAREHLERLHCQNFQLIAHDSRYAHLDYTIRAEKVLVDPPCTGLGVMPKLSIDTTIADVENLVSYQKQFLRAAAGIVKHGGTVVYSVCTITPQECEEMVEFAESELGLVEAAAEPRIAAPGHYSGGLSQRFDPELDGIGYFIARFRKP